ncbi:hypothetical protein FPHYL_2864 [Fusarium phyllophilum]|uniref:Uncharacterized protein n=1 Tax=Fusarium phyllophilum TaxID=47803 RepID=A0A8H5NJ01_9HYPO|nr:hypothetical protein FPHYL_2864 [Fusarium phyllophilum]
MDTEVVEYGSIARQNRELAEWHRNADYSILHPPKVKIPWSVTDRLSWSEMRRVPAGLRVLETQTDKPNSRLSVTCAAKYLSFKSEADFLSYVDVVVPDIVGPENYVLHGDGVSYRDRINEYSNTPFALHPSTQNQDLIDHIDHIQNQNVHDVIEHSQRYWGIGSCNYKPKSLLKFFRENAAVREWLTTLATLLTEPKLIPTFVPIRPGTVSDIEEEFCKELFILSHAVQIMLFAPVYWHEDGSYKSTDSYTRRFPLKFPPPDSKDEKAFGEYTLDDLYRALILQEFLFRQTYDEREERRCKKLVSAIPPKADAQWLGYSVGRLAIAEQNVEGVVDQRVAFRMNLDIDTLRVFDMRLPDFLTANGPSTLPVRKLLSISKIIPKSCATYEDPVWSLGSPVGDALDLEKLPKLDEFSVISPNVAEGWMIEDLPLVRPQTDVSGPAHTGIKWQFNTGLYPVPHKEGRFHDSHFIGSEKPSMHPKATITDEAIPYVGKWGYERSPGAIGGHWSSFQYFEETRDVYFAPLSWKEVEPLVKGPFGENGREALYEDHTPRFVAKLRIIRQGTIPPTGWIKVEQVRPNDPKWKRQLLNTWKSVWYTLVDLRTQVNVIISPPKPCEYFLRQT